MAVALHESRRQTEELLQTLETKVQECTRALLAARAEVVQDTVRMVDSQASLQKVRIVCELDAALPLIWVDADLIKQVVMNLLVNAQQAIVGSGVVTVQTRLCADASHPQQGAQPAMVELTVSDSIPGIHSESGLRHSAKSCRSMSRCCSVSPWPCALRLSNWSGPARGVTGLWAAG